MASPRISGKGAVRELHIWPSRAGLGLGSCSGDLKMESCLFLVCRAPHPNVGAGMEMGVDVSKFSEVDIKMDGVFGSGIVHLICKSNYKKTLNPLNGSHFPCWAHLL